MEKGWKEINTKSMNANLNVKYIEEIKKIAKKYAMPKGTYAKMLLVRALEKYQKDKFVFYIQEGEIEDQKCEFISFRVGNDVYEKIQTISLNSKLLISQISGYLIELELKKELEEGEKR